jgi:hypothetical protein
MKRDYVNSIQGLSKLLRSLPLNWMPSFVDSKMQCFSVPLISFGEVERAMYFSEISSFDLKCWYSAEIAHFTSLSEFLELTFPEIDALQTLHLSGREVSLTREVNATLSRLERRLNEGFEKLELRILEDNKLAVERGDIQQYDSGSYFVKLSTRSPKVYLLSYAWLF